MAKETMETIAEAERKARENIASAKKEAENIKSEAERQAQKIKEQRAAADKKNLELLLKGAREAGEKILKDGEAETEREKARLKDQAESRWQDAVRALGEAVLEREEERT